VWSSWLRARTLNAALPHRGLVPYPARVTFCIGRGGLGPVGGALFCSIPLLGGCSGEVVDTPGSENGRDAAAMDSDVQSTGGTVNNETPDNGSGGDSEADPSLRCDAPLIFEQKCGSSVCHGAEDGADLDGRPDLTSPGVGGRLLNAPAQYPQLDGCPSPPELLIDSSAPENSLLWKKLNGTQECGDGMPIPHSLAPLPRDDLACVFEWMEGVATP